MNSKIILIFALLAVAACVALAQDLDSIRSNTEPNIPNIRQQTNQGAENCPVRRTLKTITDAIGNLSQQARQQLSAMQSRAAAEAQANGRLLVPHQLSRQRRQTDYYDDDDLLDSNGQQLPPPPPARYPTDQPRRRQQRLDAPGTSGAPDARQPTPRELAEYKETIREHEGRMQSLMRQIMNSPYMPTRDQAIQLATTVLTLLLMMLLGPVMGAQAGMIQAMVRQVIPLIVAATVHYAADQAVPMKPLPQVNAHIEPVRVQHSAMGQVI